MTRHEQPTNFSRRALLQAGGALVVSIGAPVADLLKDPGNERWRQFSIEFCGGTHLKDSSEIQGFVITSEESVSKGIRRIVALTGLVGLVWCILQWVSTGFGPLEYAALLRTLILSLTATAIGVQLALTAFLSAIIEIPTR